MIQEFNQNLTLARTDSPGVVFLNAKELGVRTDEKSFVFFFGKKIS